MGQKGTLLDIEMSCQASTLFAVERIIIESTTCTLAACMEGIVQLLRYGSIQREK